MTLEHGNPDQGIRHPLATEFERRVRELQLTPEMYASSTELHAWCLENSNLRYVPEWLLKVWGIKVDAFLRAA